MIAYLSGRLVESNPDAFVIDVQGIGYRVLISKYTYEAYKDQEKIHLLTHLQVKEDSHTLYGFHNKEERRMFEWLISVNGIGTGTARVMLSFITPSEISSAILTEDVNAFKKVKGVGPKTAKRIILDLKDKILKEGGQMNAPVVKANNTMKDESLSALIALGIPRPRAIKAIHLAVEQNPEIDTVESLVKQALKMMS